MNFRRTLTLLALLLSPLCAHAQDDLQHSFDIQTANTSDVTFSPNGQYLWASGRGMVWCINARSGQRDDLLLHPTGRIGAIALSNNGQTFVVGYVTHDGDGYLELYNTGQPKKPIKILRHAAGFRTIRFSPDNKQLAVLLNDGSLDVIDLATSKSVLMEPSPIPASDFQFDPTGKYLIVSCGAFAERQMISPSEIAVIDIATRKRVSSKIIEKGTGFTAISRSLQVATATFDGILIHAVSTTPEVTITETKLLTVQLTEAYPFAISSNDYAVAGNRLFRISDGKEIFLADSENPVSYAFSPDDKWLVSAIPGARGGIRVWTLPTSTETAAQ